MLTSDGYPLTSLHNLEVNTLWDGVFHLTTYGFVLAGLIILWKRAQETHVRWSGKLLIGTVLMGFGIFNFVEGIIDHQILGIHHVGTCSPGLLDLLGYRFSCVGSGYADWRLAVAQKRGATNTGRAIDPKLESERKASWIFSGKPISGSVAGCCFRLCCHRVLSSQAFPLLRTGRCRAFFRISFDALTSPARRANEAAALTSTSGFVRADQAWSETICYI